MVRIRLKRVGRPKRPYYRIVAIDSRKRRNGKELQLIGHYDPIGEENKVTLDIEKYSYWLKCGAKPSEAVERLLKNYKVPLKQEDSEK